LINAGFIVKQKNQSRKKKEKIIVARLIGDTKQSIEKKDRKEPDSSFVSETAMKTLSLL